MGRTLLDLARWSQDLPGRIEKKASQIAHDVAMVIVTDLINHTPTDVTTAASNWLASLNAPSAFDIPAIFPGSRGSTAAQSKAAAVSHALRVLSEKDPGETIYISNLVPYVADLNNGTSSQEPAGFVHRGILIGDRFAKKLTVRFTDAS